MSKIFEPLTLRSVTLKNRIVMAPMLMYTGQEDGMVNELHLAHYGARALGGVGLITTEVVAVTPQGRISHTDLGLWEDAQAEGLSRLAAMIKSCGAKSSLQLAHAGRKSSIDGEIFAASAVAYSDKHRVPSELTTSEVKDIVHAYARAAQRALSTGFDCLEIHAAHGYLIHGFLSPLTNHRSDEYGGNQENRNRLLLEIVSAVREIWPQDKPLIVRLSAEDKAGLGGNAVETTTQLCAALKDLGVDLLGISAGGLTPTFDGEIFPGYLVPYAAHIRNELNIPVGCNGSITSSELIESILHAGSSDVVYVGRELLRNPFWLLDVAKAAGVDLPLAIPTYARATGPYVRGH
ncbi:NADH:flavin oxidoreductase/NADH oxidase [Pseudomonas syringae]|uniref:NADH:flavin oxidoreductase/NADH oxidase n=1 Tax=Pseudomonas syringae TaxID=317 RepID=UPI00215AADD8|nr:NADH:flavin oxidoreductase/NADH oxidase [Pseudomonas syringae]MCR8717707.1 NADH:flavin oxidoreductase/NADH oxidase [Pseudomonas syringae]